MYAVHYKTRKPAPIEVKPSDDGNILVTGDTYEVVPKEMRERAKQRGSIPAEAASATSIR